MKGRNPGTRPYGRNRHGGRSPSFPALAGRRFARPPGAAARARSGRRARRPSSARAAKAARLFLVGEQPGDREDLEGRPFVGPAGRLLDEALAEAGIDRADAYVTNAVKHFKWEPRGKRRIHQKPNAAEIAACRPWLEAELAVVRPDVLVCLGATAAQALLGRGVRVTKERGRPLESELAAAAFATVHPSSILRAPDEASRRRERALFVDDLKVAARPRRRARLSDGSDDCSWAPGQSSLVVPRAARPGAKVESPQSKSRDFDQRLVSSAVSLSGVTCSSDSSPGQVERDRVERHGRLVAVHRLLEAGLLLGLEQRVVVERIVDAIALERHRRLELGIAALQLEVVLDHTCEQRRGLNRHRDLRGGGRDGRTRVAV